ncbi:hypothetical protein ACKC9G_12455 [Pokkaliibacter sp. CJK22405]|uniref:hypothetical protein n=1 Tax=Pokkaliibacter sp. CJK22405 TaxID=3384615 RepID=UPI0039855E7B
MALTTLRGHLDHYQAYGSSQASSLHVRRTKADTQYRAVHKVTDKVYDRLALSSQVAKTIDALCSKGNQLDSLYEYSGVEAYRVDAMRDLNLGTDPVKHRVFSGNCGELADFGEHILAAVNAMRAQKQQTTGEKQDIIPVTMAHWVGDHAFPMLGDPRVSKPKHVVTVDGWVMRPSAHTLANSAFLQGGMQVHSSTLKEPESYLDQVLSRSSLQELEHQYEGRPRTSEEHQKWYQELREDIVNGDFKLWDHQYSDANHSALNFYESPSNSAVNYDFLPKAEMLAKWNTHVNAKGSDFAQALNERYLREAEEEALEEDALYGSGDEDDYFAQASSAATSSEATSTATTPYSWHSAVASPSDRER